MGCRVSSDQALRSLCKSMQSALRLCDTRQSSVRNIAWKAAEQRLTFSVHITD